MAQKLIKIISCFHISGLKFERLLQYESLKTHGGKAFLGKFTEKPQLHIVETENEEYICKTCGRRFNEDEYLLYEYLIDLYEAGERERAELLFNQLIPTRYSIKEDGTYKYYGKSDSIFI